MLDQLRAMAVFAKTVESGSFRGAARLLKLSPSVVSHHVAQLEQELDVLLLYRTTRRIALTEEGKKLYAAARDMLAAAEQGVSEIAVHADNPSGHLGVACPAAFANGPFIDDVAEFAKQFPRVTLSLMLSDAPIDLIGNGVDVAIRGGALKDSDLRSKKLFHLTRKLVAAPSYVAKRARPTAPRELADWDWIRLSSRPAQASFVARDGKRAVVDFSSRLLADNALAILQLARRGLGLCMVPDMIAAADLKARRMVEVLKGWTLEAPAVYAVWPASAPRSGLGMRFVSFLEQRERERA